MISIKLEGSKDEVVQFLLELYRANNTGKPLSEALKSLKIFQETNNHDCVINHS